MRDAGRERHLTGSSSTVSSILCVGIPGSVRASEGGPASGSTVLSKSSSGVGFSGTPTRTMMPSGCLRAALITTLFHLIADFIKSHPACEKLSYLVVLDMAGNAVRAEKESRAIVNLDGIHVHLDTLFGSEARLMTLRLG